MAKKTSNFLDIIALSTMGMSCYCYLIYGSNFAEKHINLSFCDFPVFIGELLLIFISILFLIKVVINKPNFNRFEILFFIFIIWIIYKAIYGYIISGPISFRNAALFYYMIFAYFGFIFYNVEFLKHRFTKSIVFIFLIRSFIFINITTYSWVAFVMIYLINLSMFKNKIIKICGILFIVYICINKIDNFYWGSRSHVVSIFIVYTFLICVLAQLLIKRKRVLYRIGIIISFVAVIMFFIFNFGDKNSIESLTNFRLFKSRYDFHSRRIEEARVGFKYLDISPKIYKKNEDLNRKIIVDKVFDELVLNYESKDKAKRVNEINEMWEEKAILGNDENSISVEENKSDKHLEGILGLKKKSADDYKDLDGSFNTMLFRLFIWQDMVEEIIEKKALFGMSFGYPQRSKRIEVLNWADGEWKRDGWITPHNSFLHMIYRLGIVAIILMSICIFVIFKMINIFIHSNSMKGLFLIAILIYHIVLSNFLVILEFPHHAIPFWSLFGMALAYSQEVVRRNLKNENPRYT